jgi:polar amino acid transport system substrate-binding protein
VEVPAVRVTRRPLPAILTAAALAVTVTACGGGGDTGGQAPAAEGGVELVNPGALTVCTALPYEPFQFQQGDEIVGFDVDMIDLVAERIGVTQEIVDTPFDNIQSGIAFDTGACDIGAAAMTITPERDQNIDFSDPYFDATQALMVPPGSDITGPEQLPGRRLGVQNSTTGALYAQENFAGVELVTFDDLGLLLTAVQTGEVDAAINDNAPLLDFAGKNPGFTVTAEFDTGEEYGFGVRTGNTALLEEINAAIADAKANGTYDELFAKWFPAAPTDG